MPSGNSLLRSCLPFQPLSHNAKAQLPQGGPPGQGVLYQAWPTLRGETLPHRPGGYHWVRLHWAPQVVHVSFFQGSMLTPEQVSIFQVPGSQRGPFLRTGFLDLS